MPQVVPFVVAAIKVAVVAVKAFAVARPLLWAGAKVIGAAMLASALRPKTPRMESAGTQLAFKADLSAGLPVAVGETAVGGNIIHQYPSGAKNKYMSFIVALCAAGPVESIDEFHANRTLTTFHASTGAVTNSVAWASVMWQNQVLGDTPESAPIAMPTTPASAGGFTHWTSAHKVSGMAKAWWVVEYNADAYPSGVPVPMWLGKWVKCYDPREDDDFPGGSGSHDITDPTTWDWTENPYIIGLQFCLGWFANGKRVAGAGIDPDLIDMQAFVDGANVADDNEWVAGGQFTTRDNKWQVLKAILQSGGGRPSMNGARVSCIVNSPRTSIDTLGEDEVYGPVSVKSVKSKRDRVNSITPRYRSPAHDWQVVAAAPVTESAYVTADGGLRSREIDYPFVQGVAQASQLAAYDIVNGREFEPITISVGPKWMGYRPGDCITVDIPQCGLVSQKAVITGREIDPEGGGVTLTLVSETDSKHAYALGLSGTAPPSPGLSVPDFGDVPAPGGGSWTATPTQETNATGAQIATITVDGGFDNNFAVEAVIEFRKDGTTDWLVAGSIPRGMTHLEFGGVAPETDYEVAVRYRSIFRVTGARLVLGPITTLTGYVGPTQIQTVYITGTTHQTDFVDEDQPTIPLQSTARVFATWDDDFGSLSGRIAVGTSPGGNWAVGDVFTTFYNNDLTFTAPKVRRIRTGDVTFCARAWGAIDHYLSIWYRIDNGITVGTPIMVAKAISPVVGVDSAYTEYVGDITIAEDDVIIWYASIADETGNPYGAGHDFYSAGLSVQAINN